MGRPKKSDKKINDPTGIDISKLDEELEKDVAKASGLLDEEDAIVEDDSNESFNQGNESYNNENVSSGGYEMPPSSNPINEDSDDIPRIDVNYVPEDDGDPTQEQVKHRSYATQGGDVPNSNGLNNDIPKVEPIIPEPIIETPPITDVNIGREPEQENLGSANPPKQPTEPKRPSINPDLQDMSPSQKRKAAEQSADALLLAYGNIVPIPFKKISSFNLGKLDNAHLKGELDKNMVVSDDGMTVKSYCEGVNAQVDQVFEITDEMKNEIRQPLVDVLLENNFALTPTQRLLMAVGGQVVTMGLTAVQFMQQNKAAMNQFKAFHKENKEARANMAKERVVVVQEPVYRTESPKKDYETIIPEPEIKTETSKKVDDYISNNNSGIVVEEVPNED